MKSVSVKPLVAERRDAPPTDTMRMVLMSGDTWDEIVVMAERFGCSSPEEVIAYALKRLKESM